MANPVTVPCAADQWTLVASNVTEGQLHRKITTPVYLQTYRDTGESAPTLRSEGTPIFLGTDHAPISASAEIDVYIWCDDVAGAVRADL
jgi:hypothetical protein